MENPLYPRGKKLTAAKRTRLLRHLIDQGKNIDYQDNYGYTLLHYVAKSGNSECVQMLIDEGCDIHARDDEGWTVLHAAASGGSTKCMKLLIDLGCDIHERDDDGWIVLYAAANNGNVDCMQLLIDLGCDIHARDDEWWTLHHVAASSGNNDCIQMLYNLGVDVTIRNIDGKTAYDIAKVQGHNSTAELLKILATNNENRPQRNDREQKENQDHASTPMETDQRSQSIHTNETHCQRCQCPDCLAKDNTVNDLKQEILDLKGRIETQENRVMNVEQRECNSGLLPLVVTTMTGFDSGDMVGKDYIQPQMRRIFSRTTFDAFTQHLEPQPVIDHLWEENILTERQLQQLRALDTALGKAEYLWSLMKQKRQFLDGVREGLLLSQQNELAAKLKIN